MQLWVLLKQNARHVVRTKLLLLLFVFSFLVQYLGIKMLNVMTVRFQGVVTSIGGADAIFVALYLQMFTAAFLAAAYGIWMVPYLHQGNRGQLTHVLPVPKELFPVGYILSMLALLVLQHLVLFLAFGMNYGFGTLAQESFPWSGLILCLAVQTLAFLVFMMALAVTSMYLGQIPTFFIGALVIFVMQLAAGVFRFDVEKYVGETSPAFSTAKAIYKLLPPMGELVFDLREIFKKPSWDKSNVELWIVWLVIFAVLFRIKIRRPGRTAPGEG